MLTFWLISKFLNRRSLFTMLIPTFEQVVLSTENANPIQLSQTRHEAGKDQNAQAQHE